MALQYKILESKKLVYVLGTGTVTFADLASHAEALNNDKKYMPPMKKLVDYRSINKLDFSTEEVETFAKIKTGYIDSFSGERGAIVAPHDLEYGIARMHDALVSASNLQVEVFREFEEALAWLDIERDADESKMGQKR